MMGIEKGKKDIGKNIYKITSYRTIVLEQYVKAKNKNEAFDMYLNKGGIVYSKINADMTEQNEDISTNYIDIESNEKTETAYVGKIVSDPCSDYADNVLIDEYANEFEELKTNGERKYA